MRGVRDQLREPGLVDEDALRPQHPGDLTQCSRRGSEVLAGTEVDDQVERLASEWQRAQICLYGGEAAVRGKPPEIQRNERLGFQSTGQRSERRTSPRAHLQNRRAAREAEEAAQQRDLHPRVHRVPHPHDAGDGNGQDADGPAPTRETGPRRQARTS